MHNLFGNVEDLRDAFLELVSLGRQKSAAHCPPTFVSSENCNIFAVLAAE